MKRCPKCEKHKATERFQRDATKPSGRDAICRDCRSVMRQANKAREYERRSRWYETHRDIERARDKSRRLYPKLQPCAVETCRQRGQRHHLTYAKPEEVLWLCKMHHAAMHLKPGRR